MTNKKLPKWLYRLESKDPNNGLWYDSNGRWVWGMRHTKEPEMAEIRLNEEEAYHFYFRG